MIVASHRWKIINFADPGCKILGFWLLVVFSNTNIVDSRGSKENKHSRSLNNDEISELTFG